MACAGVAARASADKLSPDAPSRYLSLPAEPLVEAEPLSEHYLDLHVGQVLPCTRTREKARCGQQLPQWLRGAHGERLVLPYPASESSPSKSGARRQREQRSETTGAENGKASQARAPAKPTAEAQELAELADPESESAALSRAVAMAVAARLPLGETTLDDALVVEVMASDLFLQMKRSGLDPFKDMSYLARALMARGVLKSHVKKGTDTIYNHMVKMAEAERKIDITVAQKGFENMALVHESMDRSRVIAEEFIQMTKTGFYRSTVDTLESGTAIGAIQASQDGIMKNLDEQLEGLSHLMETIKAAQTTEAQCGLLASEVVHRASVVTDAFSQTQVAFDACKEMQHKSVDALSCDYMKARVKHEQVRRETKSLRQETQVMREARLQNDTEFIRLQSELGIIEEQIRKITSSKQQRAFERSTTYAKLEDKVKDNKRRVSAQQVSLHMLALTSKETQRQLEQQLLKVLVEEMFEEKEHHAKAARLRKEHEQKLLQQVENKFEESKARFQNMRVLVEEEQHRHRLATKFEESKGEELSLDARRHEAKRQLETASKDITGSLQWLRDHGQSWAKEEAEEVSTVSLPLDFLHLHWVVRARQKRKVAREHRIARCPRDLNRRWPDRPAEWPLEFPSQSSEPAPSSSTAPLPWRRFLARSSSARQASDDFYFYDDGLAPPSKPAGLERDALQWQELAAEFERLLSGDVAELHPALERCWSEVPLRLQGAVSDGTKTIGWLRQLEEALASSEEVLAAITEAAGASQARSMGEFAALEVELRDARAVLVARRGSAERRLREATAVCTSMVGLQERVKALSQLLCVHGDAAEDISFSLRLLEAGGGPDVDGLAERQQNELLAVARLAQDVHAAFKEAAELVAPSGPVAALEASATGRMQLQPLELALPGRLVELSVAALDAFGAFVLVTPLPSAESPAPVAAGAGATVGAAPVTASDSRLAAQGASAPSGGASAPLDASAQAVPGVPDPIEIGVYDVAGVPPPSHGDATAGGAACAAAGAGAAAAAAHMQADAVDRSEPMQTPDDVAASDLGADGGASSVARASPRLPRILSTVDEIGVDRESSSTPASAGGPLAQQQCRLTPGAAGAAPGAASGTSPRMGLLAAPAQLPAGAVEQSADGSEGAAGASPRVSPRRQITVALPAVSSFFSVDEPDGAWDSECASSAIFSPSASQPLSPGPRRVLFSGARAGDQVDVQWHSGGDNAPAESAGGFAEPPGLPTYASQPLFEASLHLVANPASIAPSSFLEQESHHILMASITSDTGVSIYHENLLRDSPIRSPERQGHATAAAEGLSPSGPTAASPLLASGFGLPPLLQAAAGRAAGVLAAGAAGVEEAGEDEGEEPEEAGSGTLPSAGGGRQAGGDSAAVSSRPLRGRRSKTIGELKERPPGSSKLPGSPKQESRPFSGSRQQASHTTRDSSAATLPREGSLPRRPIGDHLHWAPTGADLDSADSLDSSDSLDSAAALASHPPAAGAEGGRSVAIVRQAASTGRQRQSLTMLEPMLLQWEQEEEQSRICIGELDGGSGAIGRRSAERQRAFSAHDPRGRGRSPSPLPPAALEALPLAFGTRSARGVRRRMLVEEEVAAQLLPVVSTVPLPVGASRSKRQVSVSSFTNESPVENLEASAAAGAAAASDADPPRPPSSQGLSMQMALALRAAGWEPAGATADGGPLLDARAQLAAWAGAVPEEEVVSLQPRAHGFVAHTRFTDADVDVPLSLDDFIYRPAAPDWLRGVVDRVAAAVSVSRAETPVPAASPDEEISSHCASTALPPSRAPYRCSSIGPSPAPPMLPGMTPSSILGSQPQSARSSVTPTPQSARERPPPGARSRATAAAAAAARQRAAATEEAEAWLPPMYPSRPQSVASVRGARERSLSPHGGHPLRTRTPLPPRPQTVEPGELPGARRLGVVGREAHVAQRAAAASSSAASTAAAGAEVENRPPHDYGPFTTLTSIGAESMLSEVGELLAVISAPSSMASPELPPPSSVLPWVAARPTRAATQGLARPVSRSDDRGDVAPTLLPRPPPSRSATPSELLPRPGRRPGSGPTSSPGGAAPSPAALAARLQMQNMAGVGAKAVKVLSRGWAEQQIKVGKYMPAQGSKIDRPKAAAALGALPRGL